MTFRTVDTSADVISGQTKQEKHTKYELTLDMLTLAEIAGASSLHRSCFCVLGDEIYEAMIVIGKRGHSEMSFDLYPEEFSRSSPSL